MNTYRDTYLSPFLYLSYTSSESLVWGWSSLRSHLFLCFFLSLWEIKMCFTLVSNSSLCNSIAPAKATIYYVWFENIFISVKEAMPCSEVSHQNQSLDKIENICSDMITYVCWVPKWDHKLKTARGLFSSTVDVDEYMNRCFLFWERLSKNSLANEP